MANKLVNPYEPRLQVPLPDHPLFRDLTGQRFNRLIIVEYAGRTGKKGDHVYRCVCDCMNEITTRGYCLTMGDTKSCGCLLKQAQKRLVQSNRIHDMSWSREWRIWSGIKTRCTNPKRRSYKDYGGRGILMCDRWANGEDGLTGFECFLKDIGLRPTPKHSVERVDNDGNYEPENCKWIPRSEQVRNTRVTVRLAHEGITRTAMEWSAITGVTAREITRRMGRGWTAERAIFQPERTPAKRKVACE